MKSKNFLLLLLNVACFYILQGCQTSSANEAVLLKFNLQNGKIYTYSMVMNMETKKMNTTIDSDYEVKVVNEDAGVKTINTVYKRMAMRMDMPGMNINVDTDKPVTDTTTDSKSNPMGMVKTMFKAMIGKSFTMKVDAEGKLLEISGVKEMKQAILSSIKTSDDIRPVLEQAFTAQFNEDKIKQSFSQAFTIFPNKAVKVGDTWEKTMTITGQMPVISKTNYTVKDIQKGKVTLQVLTDIDMSGNKMKQSGSMEVEPATGLVTNADFEQKMTSPVKLTTRIKISGKEM